eukprot:gene9010-16652_t
MVANNSAWWAFSVCLVLIVVEGVYNVLVRKGKEFDWVCPSAFFYTIVLLSTLISLRRDMVSCITQGISEDSCFVVNAESANGLTKYILGRSMSWRAMIIEQTGVLMLIIGRWTLPKGSISRNQFSQIILIYIATAADIVEFSEIYGEEKVSTVPETSSIFRDVMGIWGWSILQFSLTIALPEEGLKQDDEEEDLSNAKWRQTNRVAPMSYLHYKSMLTKGWDTEAQKSGTTDNRVQWRGGKFEVDKTGHGSPQQVIDDSSGEDSSCCLKGDELNKCIAKHLELIACLIPVLMQDGPFFAYRMVLLIKYKIVSSMMILLTIKNALVIIVQIYRIMILYCYESDENEPDINDPSVRVQTALKGTHGISKRSISTFKGSAALQAISRMQVSSNQHKKTPAVA